MKTFEEFINEANPYATYTNLNKAEAKKLIDTVKKYKNDFKEEKKYEELFDDVSSFIKSYINKSASYETTQKIIKK